MDISVNFLNDQFELSLDTCKAKLSVADTLLLRKNLAQQLLKAWQKPAGFWNEKQAELDELQYIVFTLEHLDKSVLTEIIISHPSSGWVALLDFTQQEHPKLADALKEIIKSQSKKKYDLFFSSPEELADYLHLKPADSIIEVLETLTNIQAVLSNYSTEITQLLAEQKALHTKIQPVINDKAFSFLDYLGGLPASNLRLILKRISRKELELLFSTCKMLKANKLFEQLRAIFPDNLFQQFEKNCPTKVEEHEVRSLLTKLNNELKALKELLNTRTQS